MSELTEAQTMILNSTPVLGSENVPVLDALNRVLVEDIIALEDLPVADISAVDGYAVRHADLTTAMREGMGFKIIGESRAGKPLRMSVQKDEAVRIMTGALLPHPADTVIKLEHAAEENNFVFFTARPVQGEGIRYRGESMRNGDTVLSAGTVLKPLEIGALAGLRRAYVRVHRKPVVAILSTGDELSDFHEPYSSSKAMSANLYALAAQVTETGGIPFCLGIANDTLPSLLLRLREGSHADVIITSGGTSKGKYDLIRQAFKSMGIKMRFSNMREKPRKPTIFGTVGDKMVFGLPGNPYASMLSFDHFIKPALLKMMGHHDIFHVYSRLNGHFSRIDTCHERKEEMSIHQRAPHVLLGKFSEKKKTCPSV